MVLSSIFLQTDLAVEVLTVLLRAMRCTALRARPVGQYLQQVTEIIERVETDKMGINQDQPRGNEEFSKVLYINTLVFVSFELDT